MKRGAFASFWTAQSSITLADVVYIMVITTYMYQESGSAFIAALFPLLNAAAKFAAGFTVPLLMARFPFARLLIMLQLAKALLLTALVLLFPFIASHVYVLCFFIILIACTNGWGGPLLQSVVPRLVPPDRLVKANSSLSMTDQALQIAGYTFTGYLVIRFGHMPTLVITAALIWISALCLKFATAGMGENVTETGRATPSRKAILEGWAHLWRIPTLRIVTLMDIIEGVAGTIWVGAITLVYVKEVLQQGEEWWGFINASYYAGAILGGLVTVLISKFIQKHLIACMAAGSALFSLLTLWYGLNSIPIVALLLCIGMGPAYQLRDVAQQTAFQTSVSLDMLPKVYASRGILLSTITSVSMGFIGLIADTLGIRMVYFVGAACIAVSAGLSFVIVRLQGKQPAAVGSSSHSA